MLKFEELCVNLHRNLNKDKRMKQIKILCMVLTVITVMASCISSNSSETTLYNDASILTFTLGTVNRYVHTQASDGSDSIYKTTVTGSNYTFHIDQVNRRIYNTDSLPVGTDIAHVVCTVTARNNGLVIIQDMDSDTLRYYSSTDSIDFTQPRKFLVYSSDGSGSNEYTVSVNVHQEEAEEFVWQLVSDNWTVPNIQMISLPQGIKQLLGGSTHEQYALSDDNKLMVSRDGGTSWQEDLLDEDASLLPTQDIALICYPMYLVDNTDYMVLVGNRSESEYPQESIAMVWRKIVDNGDNAQTGRWTYMERTDGNRFALPRLQNLSIVKYDDGLLAIGGAGIGGCTVAPYSQIYQSRDNGLTWKYNSHYQLPEGFDTQATSVAASTDSNNFLWLHCSGTGQVWRGRLNRLGWEQQ